MTEKLSKANYHFKNIYRRLKAMDHRFSYSSVPVPRKIVTQINDSKRRFLRDYFKRDADILVIISQA
jgi:hypothetical protein